MTTIKHTFDILNLFYGLNLAHVLPRIFLRGSTTEILSIFGKYVCIGGEDSYCLLLLGWHSRKVCQDDSSEEIWLSMGGCRVDRLR